MAMAAIGITACSKSQAPDPENSQAEEHMAETATTYHISIPATLGDGADTKAVSFDGTTSTSTFATTEMVYVYNSTKTSMLTGYLQPDNNGFNCNLVGDLTGTTIEEGDELTLYYNAVLIGAFPYYNFTQGDGTASSVLDGATASVTVNSVDPSLSTSDAHFSKLASMFRFKFEDGNGIPIEVHSLTVCSNNNSLVTDYEPLEDPSMQYTWGSISMNITPYTSDYLYMEHFFDVSRSDASDALTFIAENGAHVFRGTKTAPAAGFMNGKYYYNTAAIQLTDMGAIQPPTITWTNPSAIVPTPSAHIYNISPTSGINISLSGTSLGYCFYLAETAKKSTVNLNSLTAAKYEYPFIIDEHTLILNISGTNSIDCRDVEYALLSYGDIRLQGNGTLTVTSNLDETCGLWGDNYAPTTNDYLTTTALDVSQRLRAMIGYTVIRSDRTDNPDGTYSWTYTVTPTGAIPSKFSISATEKVYFSQGNLQATTSDNGAHWTWAFATNQWDYVGNNNANNAISGNGSVDYNGPVDLFGWSTSATTLGIHNSADDATYSGDFADWGNNANVKAGIGSGWRTLTAAQWTYLLNTRTVNGGTGSGHSFTLGQSVNSTLGVVIYPDNYSGAIYAGSDWPVFEAAGCVFLPAAGHREGAVADYVNSYGYYWSSTPDLLSPTAPYSLLFNGAFVFVESNVSRHIGSSVRLVRDAN